MHLEDVMLREEARHKGQILSDSVQGKRPDRQIHRHTERVRDCQGLRRRGWLLTDGNGASAWGDGHALKLLR